jgi:hypothetical protein
MSCSTAAVLLNAMSTSAALVMIPRWMYLLLESLTTRKMYILVALWFLLLDAILNSVSLLTSPITPVLLTFSILANQGCILFTSLAGTIRYSFAFSERRNRKLANAFFVAYLTGAVFFSLAHDLKQADASIPFRPLTGGGFKFLIPILHLFAAAYWFVRQYKIRSESLALARKIGMIQCAFATLIVLLWVSMFMMVMLGGNRLLAIIFRVFILMLEMRVESIPFDILQACPNRS